MGSGCLSNLIFYSSLHSRQPVLLLFLQQSTLPLQGLCLHPVFLRMSSLAMVLTSLQFSAKSHFFGGSFHEHLMNGGTFNEMYFITSKIALPIHSLPSYPHCFLSPFPALIFPRSTYHELKCIKLLYVYFLPPPATPTPHLCRI